jgi:hypothetical protein
VSPAPDAAPAPERGFFAELVRRPVMLGMLFLG